ncbi:H+-transporting two-sector ATPase alpha/beta subunit central, partial [Trifolium medium]|nr:H+-transporting two-sector ATPase alpha/beta subunit central [Trifolium medium]
MVEVCSGLVLGVKRVESKGDGWKWREEEYTVKEAYNLLIEKEEEEEQDWFKDVWNQLIPSNMSTLAWRLFHKRLPTKENLIKRGVSLNSSALCVGGCGELESSESVSSGIFNQAGSEAYTLNLSAVEYSSWLHLI